MRTSLFLPGNALQATRQQQRGDARFPRRRRAQSAQRRRTTRASFVQHARRKNRHESAPRFTENTERTRSHAKRPRRAPDDPAEKRRAARTLRRLLQQEKIAAILFHG